MSELTAYIDKHLEVASDSRIALLQSSDRLVDLVGFDELSVGDASR